MRGSSATLLLFDASSIFLLSTAAACAGGLAGKESLRLSEISQVGHKSASGTGAGPGVAPPGPEPLPGTRWEA